MPGLSIVVNNKLVNTLERVLPGGSTKSVSLHLKGKSSRSTKRREERAYAIWAALFPDNDPQELDGRRLYPSWFLEEWEACITSGGDLGVEFARKGKEYSTHWAILVEFALNLDRCMGGYFDAGRSNEIVGCLRQALPLIQRTLDAYPLEKYLIEAQVFTFESPHASHIALACWEFLEDIKWELLMSDDPKPGILHKWIVMQKVVDKHRTLARN